jgi:DNA repair exonuclease SbcCD ATPase subunit
MLTALVDALTAAARNNRSSMAEAPATAFETERRELAGAIERQTRAIADLVEQLEKIRTAAAVERDADGPTALDDQLAEARRAVGEAAARVDSARRGLERNVPADVVATRLPDSPLRTKIIDRLSVERLRSDLRAHEALLAKSSSVYGRNHPRMAELRETTEQLRRQVAGFPGAPGDVSDGTGKPAPEELVIGALEAEHLSMQSRENDIAARQAARNQRLDAQQKLETQLGEARQELAFLHGEHDRIRREIDTARSEETARLPAVVEPPTLSPDPIAPSAGLPMAVSCVAGMALYLLLLWQLRSRHEHAPVVARARRQSPKTPAPERRRGRFRSEEEQRLARLKMLSGALSARP